MSSTDEKQQCLKQTDFLKLDGAVYKILEYLTVSDFYTLGALTGSRFWKRFLFENPHSEYLYSPHGHRTIKNGRTRLKNLYYFRKAVERSSPDTNLCRKQSRKRSRSMHDQQIEGQQSLNRVGVFSPQEEDAILVNDSLGYFGVCFFRSGVLGIWGDFSGMFLTSHVDRIFSSQKIVESKPDVQAQVCSTEIIEFKPNSKKEETTKTKDGPSQTPPTYDRQTMDKDGSGYLFADSYQVMAILEDCKPYIFLGFASGAIHSIHTCPSYKKKASSSPSKDQTATESGKIVEYWHVSECRYHCQRGEISSLASVADQHIVSSSMRVNATESEILIHWNALKDGNLQRISRMKIDSETFLDRGSRLQNEIWDVSPLAMASSTYLPQWNGPVLSIGARGQNLTHVCLWSNDDTPNETKTMAETKSDKQPPFFKPSRTFRSGIFRDEYRAYRSRRNRDRRSHHFVFLKYFQHNKLIVGTSKGDILRIEMDKRYLSTNKGNPYILLNCCKGGMVETVELVGNKNPIMITGGGYDGRIQFWDWDSFTSLGSLRIHPGQQALVAEASLATKPVGIFTAIPISHHRFSPVVSTFLCHERSSLISFCRDGHIHEWKVEDEATQKTIANKKARSDSESSCYDGRDKVLKQYCFPRAHR